VVTDDWPSAGTRLAFRYRLVARIQAGGMAVVWRARDELLGREVALKLLAGPLAGSRGVFDLVRREARAAARLSHPNVTAVHDYGEAVRPDGAVAPFVVMELLDGHMLAGRLERGPLPWPEAAAIGADIADGLAAIHRSGIVHRDVTPGNVMLTPGGVKVVDFGISAAIGEPDEDSSGSTFGTPAYVAPERLDGLAEEPDHRPHAGQVAAALRALSRQPRAGAPTTRPTATATATPTGPASRPAGLT
jgi:serine/threonine-protein kinase